MGFNKYPYTDLHEMNLDWIIARTKELIAKWAETSAAWLTQQEAFETLKNFVNDYFDNLNVQTEINNKIDALVADGTLSDLIAPYVASGLPAVVADQISAVVAAQISAVVAAQLPAEVADQLPAIAASAAATEVGTWLSTHVDPDTGYVIDDSLTIQGAAADAKAAGDDINAVKDDLDAVSEISPNIFYFTNHDTHTQGGLTYQFIDASTIKVNGTSSANHYLGIIGGADATPGYVSDTPSTYTGKYTLRLTVLSGTGTGANVRYSDVQGGNGTLIVSQTVSVKTMDFSGAYLSMRLPTGTYSDYVVRIDIVQGAEIGDYVPYGVIYTAKDVIARKLSDGLKNGDYYLSSFTKKKILTWIDDDTASLDAVQSVRTVCNTLGIRCTFASITHSLDDAMIAELKDAQDHGYHVTTHGNASHSTWRTADTLTLDGDLAKSISILQGNGFLDCDMFVYPGNTIDREDADILGVTKKWCRCGVKDYVSASGAYWTEYGQGRYLINRRFIDKSSHSTASWYTNQLDALSENDNPWFVIGTHSNNSSQFDAQLVSDVISYAIENGWTVMTLNQALKYRMRIYDVQELLSL